MGFGIKLGVSASVAQTPATNYLPTPDLLVAYSLRKVVEAYDGDCMEVYNINSDPVRTATIPFTAYGEVDEAAIITFAADEGIDDVHVYTWYDQSGNERHAGIGNTAIYTEQFREVKGPAILKDGVFCESAGRPSLYFDGTSRYPEVTGTDGSVMALPCSGIGDNRDNKYTCPSANKWLDENQGYITGIVFAVEKSLEAIDRSYTLFEGDYSSSGVQNRNTGITTDIFLSGSEYFFRTAWVYKASSGQGTPLQILNSLPVEWDTPDERHPYFSLFSLTYKHVGSFSDTATQYINDSLTTMTEVYNERGLYYTGEYSNDSINLGLCFYCSRSSSTGPNNFTVGGAFLGHMNEFFLYKTGIHSNVPATTDEIRAGINSYYTFPTPPPFPPLPYQDELIAAYSLRKVVDNLEDEHLLEIENEDQTEIAHIGLASDGSIDTSSILDYATAWGGNARVRIWCDQKGGYNAFGAHHNFTAVKGPYIVKDGELITSTERAGLLFDNHEEESSSIPCMLSLPSNISGWLPKNTGHFLLVIVSSPIFRHSHTEEEMDWIFDGGAIYSGESDRAEYTAGFGFSTTISYDDGSPVGWPAHWMVTEEDNDIVTHELRTSTYYEEESNSYLNTTARLTDAVKGESFHLFHYRLDGNEQDSYSMAISSASNSFYNHDSLYSLYCNNEVNIGGYTYEDITEEEFKEHLFDGVIQEVLLYGGDMTDAKELEIVESVISYYKK